MISSRQSSMDNKQTAVALLVEPLLIRGGLCGAAVGGQLSHVVIVRLADFGLRVRLLAVDVDIEHDQTLSFSGRDIRPSPAVTYAARLARSRGSILGEMPIRG